MRSILYWCNYTLRYSRASIPVNYWGMGVTQTGRGPGRPTPQPVTAPSTAALSADEIAGLVFMVEEEKLAHDVYVQMYELWGVRTFSNISSSESKHMDAVRTLLSRYGIDDPTVGNGVGVFENADLQALYNELIDMGSQSVSAALQVGVLIEETDIADLEVHIAELEHDDIARVYASLLRGSQNHLRAFSR
ncbi:DUF2202 domain-containing protein [bacterium]|nr:DUF2202 domain-containing protein [bacterium]